MKIRGCIFDLDGTLTNTVASIARPCNLVLEHYGLAPLPVENYCYYAGDGMFNTMKRALAGAGVPDAPYEEDAIRMCLSLFAEDPLYQVVPYDGIPETLRELRSRGLKTGVFSNKPHAEAISVVRSFFGDLIDEIIGQSDRIPKKPDPTGAFEMLDAMGIVKEECLYIGDTNTDMRTGHAAGLFTVGVTWGFRPRSELEEFGADAIIDHPAELLGLL